MSKKSNRYSNYNSTEVPYGEFRIENSKKYLITYYLYSCIAVVLWDRNTRISAMSHIPAVSFNKLDGSPNSVRDLLTRMFNECQERGINFLGRVEISIIGGKTGLSETAMISIFNNLLSISPPGIMKNVDIFGPQAKSSRGGIPHNQERYERNIALDRRTGKIKITNIPEEL